MCVCVCLLCISCVDVYAVGPLVQFTGTIPDNDVLFFLAYSHSVPLLVRTVTRSSVYACSSDSSELRNRKEGLDIMREYHNLFFMHGLLEMLASGCKDKYKFLAECVLGVER